MENFNTWERWELLRYHDQTDIRSWGRDPLSQLSRVPAQGLGINELSIIGAQIC